MALGSSTGRPLMQQNCLSFSPFTPQPARDTSLHNDVVQAQHPPPPSTISRNSHAGMQSALQPNMVILKALSQCKQRAYHAPLGRSTGSNIIQALAVAGFLHIQRTQVVHRTHPDILTPSCSNLTSTGTNRAATLEPSTADTRSNMLLPGNGHNSTVMVGYM